MRVKTKLQVTETVFQSDVPSSVAPLTLLASFINSQRILLLTKLKSTIKQMDKEELVSTLSLPVLLSDEESGSTKPRIQKIVTIYFL